MPPLPDAFREPIAEIVRRLAAGDYGGLARDRVAPDSIGTWIEDYPATLIPLPIEAWQHSDFGALDGTPHAYWVTVDLWTREEGRSDLTLEATVHERDTRVEVHVDDVHVL